MTPTGTVNNTSVTPAGTISNKDITPAGTIGNTTLTTNQIAHIEPLLQIRYLWSGEQGNSGAWGLLIGKKANAATQNNLPLSASGFSQRNGKSGEAHTHSWTGTKNTHNHTFTGTAANHNHTFTGTQVTINHMNPYIVAYCFKRIS